MASTPHDLMKLASSRLKEQEKSIQELNAKLASHAAKIAEYERKELAEEIVSIKVASGATDPEDFLAERQKLVEGDMDLAQIKTAMQYAGPQFARHSLVENEGAEESKVAGTGKPHRVLANAQAELKRLLEDLEIG
jgi:hypothetical protein